MIPSVQTSSNAKQKVAEQQCTHPANNINIYIYICMHANNEYVHFYRLISINTLKLVVLICLHCASSTLKSSSSKIIFDLVSDIELFGMI